jgi:hypothetical protein
MGFTDTFGQYHWAPRQDLNETIPKIKEHVAKCAKRDADER